MLYFGANISLYRLQIKYLEKSAALEQAPPLALFPTQRKNQLASSLRVLVHLIKINCQALRLDEVTRSQLER